MVNQSPWRWEDIDWWTDPALAFGAGYADGFRAGRLFESGQNDLAMASILDYVFGANAERGRRLVAAYEQIEARKRADRPGPRPGDYGGLSANGRST